MLIRFNLANFLSFKSGNSLRLECEKINEHEDTNTFLEGNTRLLKSAVIYGANASGKSNLLNAMEVMKDLVLNSSKESNATEDINVVPFRLSTVTENEPTLFEIEFFQNTIKYRYGFSVDTKKIHEEWLYHKPDKEVEAELFSRKLDVISMSEESEFFLEGKDLAEKTRHNALFLSVVANFNGTISQSIQEWFENLDFISGIKNNNLRHTSKMLQNKIHKDKIIKLLHAADFGIEDLTVEDVEQDFPKIIWETAIPENISKSFILRTSQVLLSSRKKYDENNKEIGLEMFNVNQSESEGTKKFISLVGPIIEKLNFGGVLVIDELDAKMHPKMTREIVKLFNSFDTNYRNAQLIFASHDISNLSNNLFRRDQLWFVEKNNHGSSELFSLAEFRDEEDKRIRKDETYAKNYMLGKYGGTPNLSSWRKALED